MHSAGRMVVCFAVCSAPEKAAEERTDEAGKARYNAHRWAGRIIVAGIISGIVSTL